MATNFLMFFSALIDLGEKRKQELYEENILLTFTLTLLLSLIVYCVPVVIYRFGIRRGAPLKSKWKATWVGWIFWVCSYTTICLYYLIAGFYDMEGFSVKVGICDVLCMSFNWFLLYCKFRSKSSANKSPTSSDSSLCSMCGAPLTDSAKFCTECGEKVAPSGMIICPSCKNTVVKGKFCPECGYQFINPRTPSPSPTAARTSPRVPSLPSNDGSPLADAHIYVDSLGEITDIKSSPQKEPSVTNDSDGSVFHYVLIACIAAVVLTAVFVWLVYINH